MHPPSRCALRRTGKQQRAKAGMNPPVKKGSGALPPYLHKSGGKPAAGLPRRLARRV